MIRILVLYEISFFLCAVCLFHFKSAQKPLETSFHTNGHEKQESHFYQSDFSCEETVLSGMCSFLG